MALEKVDGMIKALEEDLGVPTAPPTAEEANPTDKAKGKEKQKGGDKQKVKAPAPAPVEEGSVFSKCLLQVGKIVECIRHPESEKLYIEKIDIGEPEPRTVVSGLQKFIPLEEMQNRMVVVITNLEAKKLAGIVSHAMVLCAKPPEGEERIEFVTPPPGAVVGERVFAEGHDQPAMPVIKGKDVARVYGKAQEQFSTTPEFVVTWNGQPWRTQSGGLCTVQSIAHAHIS